MLSFGRLLPGRRAARRHESPITAASRLLGTPVLAIVPLQRHHPAVVLAASIAEISALAALVATGSLASMVVLLGLSALLSTVMITNRRRVVAMTGKGNALLTASARGRPTGVLGPARRDISLPQPEGLGVSLDIEGQVWWIDRSSFRLLRRARLTQTAELEAE